MRISSSNTLSLAAHGAMDLSDKALKLRPLAGGLKINV